MLSSRLSDIALPNTVLSIIYFIYNIMINFIIFNRTLIKLYDIIP